MEDPVDRAGLAGQGQLTRLLEQLDRLALDAPDAGL
jgi:hypothetical protein